LCSSCGADVVFEPQDGFLSCRYCGHKERIPESAKQVEEQSFEQFDGKPFLNFVMLE